MVNSFSAFLAQLCGQPDAPEHWGWLLERVRTDRRFPSNLTDLDEPMSYLLSTGTEPSLLDALEETVALYLQGVRG